MSLEDIERRKHDVLNELREINQKINDGTTLEDLLGFDPDIKKKEAPSNPYVTSGRRDEHLKMIDEMIEKG